MAANDSVGSPRTAWQRFRLLVKVIELRLRFVVLMALTGLGFAYWDTIANRLDKWMRPAAERTTAQAGVEYFCPMHPNVVRGESGSCPICGMPLSRRKKGEPQRLPEGVIGRVQLAPMRVAQAGIETVAAEYAPLVETITTVGFVEFDERRQAHIASKVRGMARVEKLYVNFTGVDVVEGQTLAELYSPELYQAIQELLLASRAAPATARTRSAEGRALLGEPEDLKRLAVDKLRLWGITPAQVQQIVAKGRADERVPIVAPIGGHVVKKNVVEGQYVSEGQPMFELAGLDTVWVKARVFEDQVGLVRVGQEVEAAVEAFPGRVFAGKVAFIQPHLDPATRTVDVRFDLANSGHELRPGMFATVTLRTPVADTSLVRSRTAESTGGSAHHPEAPARRLNLTVAEQRTCPVTTAKLGTMGPPVAAQVKGGRVWTCCDACPPKLAANPGRYLDPPPRSSVLSIPESAVIDTGARRLVYVETAPGVYEGRSVVLGPRAGDRFPVIEGLGPGERVVAHGAFLVDAESRLNPAERADAPAAGHDHH